MPLSPLHKSHICFALFIALGLHGVVFAAIHHHGKQSATVDYGMNAAKVMSVSISTKAPVKQEQPVVQPVTETTKPIVEPQKEMVTQPHPITPVKKAAVTKPTQVEPVVNATPAKQEEETLIKHVAKAQLQETSVASIPLVSDYDIFSAKNAPDYPRHAKRKRQQGTVFIQARVNHLGHVEETKLVKSSNFHLLDDEAIQTVRQWRVKPEFVASKLYQGWFEVPIQFTLIR